MASNKLSDDDRSLLIDCIKHKLELSQDESKRADLEKLLKSLIKRTQSQVGKSNVGRSKSHERRVARLLCEWSGKEFRRRRVEGRDTSILERESASDVIPVTGNCLFTIEAKCGEGFGFESLLATPTVSLFTSWWHQSCYDAKLVSECLHRKFYPLVIFKPIPAFDWVAFSALAFPLLKPKIKVEDSSDFNWLSHIRYDCYGPVNPVECDISHTKNKKLYKLDLDPVIFCRWRDFSASVDPSSVLFDT